MAVVAFETVILWTSSNKKLLISPGVNVIVRGVVELKVLIVNVTNAANTGLKLKRMRVLLWLVVKFSNRVIIEPGAISRLVVNRKL